MKKIIVIGAGLTGCFIAHKLSSYEVEVTVIDRENDIANQTSMANSAIVHTGYDPEEGSLKAKLNVQGALMYPKICEDLHCDYLKCGAYVVARKEEEQVLEILHERAEKRSIRTDILSGEQARLKEPNLHHEITKVMSVPDTAVIYPWQIAIALMEEAVMNGTKLHLMETVLSIQKKERFLVRTDKGSYDADFVINAAGCGAQKIAEMLEEVSPFQIRPKKGEYFVLSKRAKGFVNHILYPTPTENGKGVLCVPTTHGNTLLGPTSEYCDMDDVSTSQTGLDLIREKLSQMVQHVPYQEIIRSYSGLRATGNDHDFYIRQSQKFPNLIHVACIDSPGLASSPAIAEYVYETFLKEQGFIEKKSFFHRKAPIVMEKLTRKEKQELIQKEPAYGEIICRCEKISRGEIVNAIHRPCGAQTIKGVKKRVRPGMGGCQGGFCEPLVAKILSQELHIPLQDVLYDEETTSLGDISKGERTCGKEI